MAFRRRFRRRRFGNRRGVKRLEPVWITTAYTAETNTATTQRDFFQLVGPEDYTPDFLTDTQRKESVNLIRTVGSLFVNPILDIGTASNFNAFQWKAAFFIDGDEAVEDKVFSDPGQFDIATDVDEWVEFCRNFDVLHTLFFHGGIAGKTAGLDGPRWDGGTGASDGWNRVEWDITVKRKMKTDQALWLLVASQSISVGSEFGGLALHVENRTLIHD